jgi:hypothetical protein
LSGQRPPTLRSANHKLRADPRRTARDEAPRIAANIADIQHAVDLDHVEVAIVGAEWIVGFFARPIVQVGAQSRGRDCRRARPAIKKKKPRRARDQTAGASSRWSAFASAFWRIRG